MSSLHIPEDLWQDMDYIMDTYAGMSGEDTNEDGETVQIVVDWDYVSVTTYEHGGQIRKDEYDRDGSMYTEYIGTWK